ncbi:hypothetical protein QTO34_004591 [Cnephaeus nilssonii]|uniref:Uncharacterized protein n=1 Tax=Cnephaeus nilssonii TaxID=3371016 RepID=A0AA40HQB4_CNENI|nr:hypothetical protein QTO34_004591 [Eptesicus nilssonii]
MAARPKNLFWYRFCGDKQTISRAEDPSHKVTVFTGNGGYSGRKELRDSGIGQEQEINQYTLIPNKPFWSDMLTLPSEKKEEPRESWLSGRFTTKERKEHKR